MSRCLCVLALLGLLVAAPVAHATFKGGNGRIAYGLTSTGIEDDGAKSGYRALATVQPDGRADRFLRECQRKAGATVGGDCSIQYRTPAWAPNGRRLAFDAGPSLALINRDGTGFTALPAITSDDSEPAWSPSGKKIAFTGKAGKGRGLYVLDVATRKAKRIARRASGPDWSSRDRIAFERGGSVYIVKSNGTGPRRLGRGRDPGFSATGRKLVLVRGNGIYTVGADGRRLRRLLRCKGCSSPSFSPDGRQVVLIRSGDVRTVSARNGLALATLVPGFRNGPESFIGSAPDWQAR
jgi:Tol biopolymer transport system component